MKLSLRAIELCRRKWGKGLFYGFENIDKSILESVSKEKVREDFDVLTQNGIIDFCDGEIHISALGHHIFNMMHEPEQYITLSNEVNGICVRVYIRDAYYLCVIADKTIKEDDEDGRYIIKLLPKLDFVIGSFVHALYCEEKRTLERGDMRKETKQDIQIEGKSWNKNGEVISEIMILGNYQLDGVYWKSIEKFEGYEYKKEEFEGEISQLVNEVTKWLFQKISIVNKKEVC